MGQVIQFPTQPRRNERIIDAFVEDLATQIESDSSESLQFMRSESQKLLERHINGINLEFNLTLSPTTTDAEIESITRQAHDAMTKIRGEMASELFSMMAEIVVLKEQLRMVKQGQAR